MSERGAPTPNPHQSPESFDYAAQWAGDGTEELTLPSGAKVVVRTPDILDFIRLEGARIPDHMAGVVHRFIAAREPDTEDTSPTELSAAEKLRRDAEDSVYLDVMVVAACVRPRLSLGEPAPGEIPVYRLSRPDRLAIWRWSEGIATAPIAGFPDQPGEADGTVPPVGDGEGLPPEAERTAGPGEAGG